MKVTVNSNLCSGCGVCAIICPEVFRMVTGGRKEFAVVHSETVPEDAVNFCVDARDCCKSSAIQIVESGMAKDPLCNSVGKAPQGLFG